MLLKLLLKPVVWSLVVSLAAVGCGGGTIHDSGGHGADAGGAGTGGGGGDSPGGSVGSGGATAGSGSDNGTGGGVTGQGGAGAGTGADGASGGAATDGSAPDGIVITRGDGGLNPMVAPGGNFDLSLWELQEPIGSPGKPTTIPPSKLVGPNGFQDMYFFTDPSDGSMAFWDPEQGVTTANSNFPRSELREMKADGTLANWSIAGNHTLSATLKATQIPDHVAVGQIHLGTGSPASTKPLLELFYFKNGAISLYIEQTPAGGNEVPHPAGNVPLGTKWSYVIGLSGNTISLTINGGTPKTFPMSPTFNQENMYFKAGDYDQSVGNNPAVGAKVNFYSLQLSHSP